MAEPSFRIRKLDLVIALLVAHTILGLVNPTIIPATDAPLRTVIAAVSITSATFLSALWKERD